MTERTVINSSEINDEDRAQRRDLKTVLDILDSSERKTLRTVLDILDSSARNRAQERYSSSVLTVLRH